MKSIKLTKLIICVIILITIINIGMSFAQSNRESKSIYNALSNEYKPVTAPQGEVLYLYGKVSNQSGEPQSNVSVEIWQTDENGYYDHSGDSNRAKRNMAFQFFGSATTDSEGNYSFRTLIPGEYFPRPRHIHFKVKKGKNTLLTSQFYFVSDREQVEDEGMFRAIRSNQDALILKLVSYNNTLYAKGQIVVRGGKGTLPLTPSQAEGPFYPQTYVPDYDNDLLILE